MPDISLLPEEMRGKEEEVRTGKKPAEQKQPGGLKMHVPDAVVDEDIEIIEVDEGDLAAVLSEEPFMTRMTYKLSLGVDKIKTQLFGKKEEAPPAKLPPQFFKPPKPGLVTKPPKPGEPVKPGVPGKPTARIMPQGEAPRRVRVIKRVRKPVRVSLISAEELATFSIDVGRRKWTLLVFTALFLAIIGGGYYLLSDRIDDSRSRLSDVEMRLAAENMNISKQLEAWSEYEDLEVRLGILDDVLNKHIVISRLFDFLEIHTLPTVSYQSANWSEGGDLSLDVIADSFDSAARQLLVYEDSEVVKRVDATSFAAQVSGETGEVEEVTFQLTVGLDPATLRGPLIEEVDEEAPDEGELETSGETTEMEP